MKKIIMRHALKIFVMMVVFQTIPSVVSGQTHYVGLSPKIGYAALIDSKFDDMNRFGLNTCGGVTAGISLFYELQYNRFLFQTGFDFDFLNSTTRITDFTINRPLEYPSYPMLYNYGFIDWRETRNIGMVYLPVMFGGQFERIFFLAGAKVGVPLAAGYTSKGTLEITATDDQFIDEIQNAYTHYIVSEKHKDNGSLALKLPSLALAAEVGVDLDEWLAAKPPRRRRGMRRPKRTFRQLLHYRASLFVDYGLLSLNDYEGNLAASRPINVSNASSQTGHLPVFKEGTPDLQGMNTVLSTDGAVNSLLNPLTVGVKFTVSYEFEKPDPPRRPRPKPKPKPKPQPKQIPPVPPVYMCGVVLNGETRAALDSASVEIYDVTGETALFLDTTKTDGMFHTKLEAGTYSGYIRRPGYLPYTGEFTYVEGDTVYILLQEIKKDIVTLLDVHFATNKTVVLPESAQTLEDLYDFLSENQTVRIKIIGHTDSVGSDESNQRLSEGRAKSVRNEMIRRGIDASRIEFEGKGEMAPIATNETEEGRAQNRRVEFIILSE